MLITIGCNSKTDIFLSYTNKRISGTVTKGTEDQDFGQDFESGSLNLLWAKGQHSIAPVSPCF